MSFDIENADNRAQGICVAAGFLGPGFSRLTMNDRTALGSAVLEILRGPGPVEIPEYLALCKNQFGQSLVPGPNKLTEPEREALRARAIEMAGIEF
jgi:hypothetical protein